MIALRKYFLLLVIVLLLAGCYRQAGDSLEPITNPTDIPAAPSENQTNQTEDATPTQETLPNSLATPTFPPVTVIQPTPNAAVTQLPTSEPQAPTEAVPAQNVPANSLTTFPTFTPVVITPSSPGGPVVFASASPTTDPNLPATPSGLITPTDIFATTQECTYTVNPGDNLFRIATNNDTTVAELVAFNNLPNDLIQPGQVLQLPNCTPGSVSAPPAPTSDTVQPPPATTGETIHVVQAGDTLFGIAQRYNVTVADIIATNNLANPDRLAIGDELKIPQ